MHNMRKLLMTGAAVLLLAGALLAAANIIGPPGDPFDRSLLRPRTQNLSAPAADTSLSITLDKSAFPSIRVYTDVFDENQMPVPGFLPEDFTVTQDGEPVRFNMVPVSDVGCPTSICLVIDVSLSMAGDPIAAAREAAHQFVDRMGPYDRAAIVSFADCTEINSPFTTNRDSLHAAIDSLQPLGLTASFDGIYQGVELVTGQPGDRAVIAFSDGCDNNSAVCSLPPDGWPDGYADDSALICDLANDAAVSIYTLTFGPIEEICLDPMEAFALGTGGNFRHAPDAGVIDSVYAAIQEAVCQRYLISFRSPDTTADLSDHLVEICLATGGAVYCDSMTYTEPFAPQGNLTPPTLALNDTCQPAGTDLTIEATIIDPDPPFIQEVQLFYREASANDLSYQSVSMSPSGNDLYTITLPGATWTDTAPGFEYFIAASDGENLVTLPTLDPYQRPFLISFCPNEPPEISDISIECIGTDSARITAIARDSANGIARTVAIVTTNDLGGWPLEMTPLEGDTFTYTLSSIVPNDDYYVIIRAWDSLGLARSVGPVHFRCGSLPENNWITLLCNGPLFAGQYLSPGDYIRAYDPDGVLVGRATVGDDSTFGSMRVFGDDPATPLIDEGAEPGDRLTFTLNALEILLSPPVYFTFAADSIEICNRIACQEYDLNSGWRLISWNRDFTADIDSLITLLGGPACVDVVMSFDRRGLTYDPDLPSFSTLTNVDYYHAYWLRLSCPADFDICAPGIMPTDSLPVYPGFNLVPYWPDSTLPITTAWSSILDYTIVAFGFAPGAVIWVPDGGQGNTLTELSPGFGYWALLSENRYLIYPGWPQPESKSPPGRTGFIADAVPPTQTWMSLYGANLTLDGAPLAEGATIEIRTADSILCGSGVYRDELLRFTPVYGASDDALAAYPSSGDTLLLSVNDLPVYPKLTFTGHSSRTPLTALSSTESPDPHLLPSTYALAQNYPNPFNPTTTISFSLPQPGHANLTVYNILGQVTTVLTDQWYPAGTHNVTWNGTDTDGRSVGSGVYLYRLQTDEANLTRKMLLLK